MQTPDEVPASSSRMWEIPSWLLVQTAAHASRLVSDGFAAVEARGYHFRVLATLDELGPASQATLGRRGGIHLSDLVTTINELADRGSSSARRTRRTGGATSSPSPPRGGGSC
ncbi:hypothetical protein ACFQ1L_03790 [Phytohabitans flavus]|uniref:hypothetical protein n=1 Tax=Phytohabitans flavus TaxID=1076124 RepID=UPI0036424EA0